MALGAFHILVFPDQWEMGGGVVELLHRFPGGQAVTLLAVGPQLPGVPILVAGEAGRMEPFEGRVQISKADLLTIGRRYIFGVVALLAAERGMAALQQVAGLAMIEFRLGCVPFENAEILAVVLGVAACAIDIALGGVHYVPVQAFAIAHESADFFVAVQAFQFGLA